MIAIKTSFLQISSKTSRSFRVSSTKDRFGRRETVLSSIGLFSIIGSDDPVTLLNGVLSGYGLPTIKSGNDLKAYDRFEDDFTFEYPRSWVEVRNRIRKGVYISNFQTADKITVEIFPAGVGVNPGDKQFVRDVVGKLISPGKGQQNDRLELPPEDKIKSKVVRIDNVDYVYIEFPSSTITRSGYQVRRLNAAVAAKEDDLIYALCASTRSEQATEEKAELFDRIVASFRLT